MDVPMYFIKRGDTYHDVTGVPFRAFLAGALRDRLPGIEPEIGDWANHLGTLFPDVRLKRYIEQRGADVGPQSHIDALPALWVGLLYDDQSLAAAAELVADWTEAERRDLRDTVPKLGLKAPFRSGTVLEIARRILPLAADGLKRRARLNAAGEDERRYLAPIETIAAEGRTLADRMLEAYHGPWQGSLDPIFEAYAL